MSPRSFLLSACAFTAWAATMTVGLAQEWTRFRGPNGSGIGQAQGLPDAWTEQDFRWKTKLPGSGHSSPVLWGDKLFITSGDEKTGGRTVLCLSADDGKEHWRREFPAAAHKKHQKNSFATSTPAVDAQHVYCCWGTPAELVFLALDHAGQDVWRRDLGPYIGNHGAGASPIVFEDLVILPNDKDKQGFIVAVDRLTGQDRWKLPRQGTRASYSTPCIQQLEGQNPTLILTDWEQGVTAVDVRSGVKKWEVEVFGQDEAKRAIGSPVLYKDLILSTCGFYTSTKLLVALRADADQTTAAEVFRLDRAVSHIPTPVVYNDLLFLWADNGIVTCADAATGETHWQKRLGGVFSGSPIVVDGRLLAVSEAGDLISLSASKTYSELGRTPLNDVCRSTPAVSGGLLYIHTASHVICLGPKPR